MLIPYLQLEKSDLRVIGTPVKEVYIKIKNMHMIKQSLFAIAVLVSAATCAQKKSDPAAFAKTITPEDLKKHLSVIASAEMEGRNTPSAGL